MNDSNQNRLVALFFMDKGNKEATDKMRDVCCDALNAAVHSPLRSQHKADRRAPNPHPLHYNKGAKSAPFLFQILQ